MVRIWTTIHYPNGFEYQFNERENSRIFTLGSVWNNGTGLTFYSKHPDKDNSWFAFKVVEVSEDKLDVWVEEFFLY